MDGVPDDTVMCPLPADYRCKLPSAFRRRQHLSYPGVYASLVIMADPATLWVPLAR